MRMAKPDPAVPKPNKAAAIIAATFGPFFSTNFPIRAADNPKKKMAILNAIVTSVSVQFISSLMGLT